MLKCWNIARAVGETRECQLRFHEDRKKTTKMNEKIKKKKKKKQPMRYLKNSTTMFFLESQHPSII